MRDVMGLWLVLLALALALPAQAAGQAADRGKLRAFLDITGFDVALESMGLSAADAPAMLGKQADDFGADWRDVADEVFAAEIVHGLALDILERALPEDLLTHAAGFYASDLGQRLVAVENAAHMAGEDAGVQAEGPALWAAATPGRRALLQRLMAAAGDMDASIRSIREVQVRFLMAASGAGVLEHDLDEGTLRAILGEGDAQLEVDLRRSGLENAARTYKSIPDSDLAAYAEALEAARMQQVYELMNAIQFEIMANRFEALALRMADMGPGQAL